ncbi:MAG: hypothetical protein NPMRTH4_20001 [Nitrosopumilales archaeon]|nr:MAG: hypothetical protein NPMRTH4_20001 [Nitrosopumilales archaeon]
MHKSGIVKYDVKLSFEVDGLVKREDIIGAVFGQTEGLLGPEMNLNELQRVSKIGRIEVSTHSTTNTTAGDVLIPMSTDIDTCALISAAIESIDKVGPFDCHFQLTSLDDVRASKKEDIVRRAKQIKQNWSTKSMSESDVILKELSIEGKNEIYDKDLEVPQSNKTKSIDPEDESIVELINSLYPNLIETLEAIGFDQDKKEIFKVPISEVVETLGNQSGIRYLVLDGIITQRLLDGAQKAGVTFLVGHRITNAEKHNGIKLKTFADLGIV